jgi:hypothetical protein
MAGAQGAGTNNVFGNNGAFITHGTGTTTPAKTDTVTQTKIDTSTATSVTTVGTGSANKYQATATVACGSTAAITEVVLESASVGVVFVHAVFSAVNVVSGDSVAYTITIDPA